MLLPPGSCLCQYLSRLHTALSALQAPCLQRMISSSHDALQRLMLCNTVQGSKDAKTWSTLRVHSNDQTLQMAGQYASWPITGYAACLSFRFFRLFQGSSSGSALPQSRQLPVAYLELYGSFGVSSPASKA